MKHNPRQSLSILTAILMLMCLFPFRAFNESLPHAEFQMHVNENIQESYLKVYDAETTKAITDNTDLICEPADNNFPDFEMEQQNRSCKSCIKNETRNSASREIWDGSIAEGFSGGAGSEEEPFLISNAAEFAYLAQQTNLAVDYTGVFFELSSDIYLNDTTGWESWGSLDSEGNLVAPANEWTAIGNSDNFFSGCFNGAGYAVHGIFINKPEVNSPENNNQGLFGSVNGSIANLKINASYIHGGFYVGGVAGIADGTISNCHNSASVSGKQWMGGITGSSNGVITDCHNSGNISFNMGGGGISGENKGTIRCCDNSGSVSGKDFSGGMAGESKTGSEITDCINTGAISGVKDHAHIGGIVGNNDKGNIIRCDNEGIISGSIYIGGIAGANFFGLVSSCNNSGSIQGINIANYVGGITGSNYHGHIYACNNSGDIASLLRTGGIAGENFFGLIVGCSNSGSVNGKDNIGGVVGGNYGSIKFCRNTQSVNATGYHVGGTAGYSNNEIIECWNTGEITGNSKVGGVIGYNDKDVKNCYNSGNVTATANPVGGVAGYNEKSLENCYNAGNVTGNGNAGGVSGLNGSGCSVKNCYYLDTCCENGSAYGTALSDEQMQNPENFAGFDFEKVWAMKTSSYLYPQIEPKCKITFIDGKTYSIISEGYTVISGTVLNEADFPEHNLHEGCEFLGWNYNGAPIYTDTDIVAGYYDPDTKMIDGYITADPMGVSDIWGEFADYNPGNVKNNGSMDKTHAAAYAGGNVYGYINNEDDTRFYIMNAETYEITYSGYSPGISVYAMAYNYPEGEMYAIALKADGKEAIYKVNLVLGTLTYVADLNAYGATITTLAIDGEGNAYGINSSLSNASLWKINLLTGVCTKIGDTGHKLNYLQSIVWDHNTDRLYWAQFSEWYDSGLYVVNPDTAETISCGKIGKGAEVTAMWIANDKPIAPIVPPQFQIKFIDGYNEQEIPGGYTVEGGSVLDPDSFPEPPEHEGMDFTGWDYDGSAIYADTFITALYRDPNTVEFYFETDPAADGWTWEDHDDDGYNWRWIYDTDDEWNVPEGCGCMNSESYDDDSGDPLRPDNWLISPAVTGGGNVSFMIIGVDCDFYEEPIGVYVSTDDGTTWSDELGYFVASDTVQTFTVDLQQFNGQEIRIAFRHYDVEELWSVNLDAVIIIPPRPVPTPEPTEEPTPEPTEEPQPGITPGDYDCNGVVNEIDALLALRAAINISIPSEQSLLNADINGNGIIDASDALEILRMSMDIL